MAVFHTPIVSISSTALTTLLAPTKPKSSNLASLPISGCVIPRSLSKIPSLFLLRATPLQKYVYPDPIPEFAVYETKKFREELKKKLYKERDTFGDDLDKVVDTCTEVILNFIHVGGYLRYFSWWSWPHCKSDVEFLMMPTSCSMKCLIKNAPCMPYLFSEFVHKEYGGPGTLVVEPFTDMLIGLKQRKLPGANLAARASLLWAQNYLDHDWEIWNSKLQ